ncbi:hypothetical protein SAMN05444166_8433 [Singulisphaera sp. GP187]|uniref:hypothetical protein n=1 Tax=Singulisphaera sp. GP187 TaxID=1882752 RepID=UPI000929534D|nr:hypothetical protein [Singulisphaera sp. GP187]SIO67731.1 hypothetical protein SAMN05444166_8433 [Singulisphaera sp. GP187]
MKLGLRHAAFTTLILLTATASATDFPQGTIAAELGGTQWTIRFEDGGTYTVSRGEDVVAEGKYTVKKDEIEMTDDQGSRAESGKTGKYTWKLVGKKLTFTKVEDEAEGRVSALTNGPWTLKD